MIPSRLAQRVDDDRHALLPGLHDHEREGLECAGVHEGGGVAQDVPLGRLVNRSGGDDVGVRFDLGGERADERERQGPGPASLVEAEETVKRVGPLVRVDPPHEGEVGTVAQPEDLAAGTPALLRVAHADAEHDLGLLGDRVDPLDEAPFRRGVVAESVGGRERVADGREVERRLVVRRGVQHRRRPRRPHPLDRDCEQVRREHDGIGVALGERVNQSGRVRAVELEPAPGLVPGDVARRAAEPAVVLEELVLALAGDREASERDAVHLEAPRRELVLPAQVVDRGRRIGLDFEARPGRQVLG